MNIVFLVVLLILVVSFGFFFASIAYEEEPQEVPDYVVVADDGRYD